MVEITSPMSISNRKTLKDRAIEYLSGLGGMAQLKEFMSAGIPQPILRRLLSEGAIGNPARGVYVVPDLMNDPYMDYAVEAMSSSPTNRVCLLTAAYLQELITRDPREMYLAIPRGTWSTKSAGRLPVTTVVYRDLMPSGVMVKTRSGLNPSEDIVLAGRNFYITAPARTIADMFKYRDMVGIETAIEALGAGLAKGVTIAEIESFAHHIGISNEIGPYLSGAGTNFNRMY